MEKNISRSSIFRNVMRQMAEQKQDEGKTQREEPRPSRNLGRIPRTQENNGREPGE